MLASLQDKKTYHNIQLATDIRTGQGSLTTHSFNPFLAGCGPSYFSAKIPSLNSYFITPLLGEARCHRLFSFPISMYPPPPTGLSNCTFACMIKASLGMLIGWGPHTFHLHIHHMLLILTMVSEKRACGSMETVTSEVYEREEKPPCSPKLLDRKHLRVANRELVGWELDCQAEVCTGLLY